MILLNTKFTVCIFHHTQGRIFSQNTKVITNDDTVLMISFLSDSQVVGVENNSQKLEVMYY